MASATSHTSWRLERSVLGVCTLWFDQPGRTQNWLDAAAFDELELRLAEAASEPALAGILIRSVKDKGFCAGVDLEMILRFGAAELERFLRRGLTVFDRLSLLAVPTVAVVHGICLGGGLELALACRHRLGLASAAPLQLGTPEVDHGLIPGWGALSRLPRLIGPAEALDLMVTGRLIGYLSARSLGLVDRLAAESGTQEAHELLTSPAATERTWPKEAWEAALNSARDEINTDPGLHPEAQLRVLEIMAIHLAQGEEAARQATIESLAALAAREETRNSIAAFLEREKRSPES